MLGSRLTLNLGLRFDHWTGTVGPDILTGGTWFEPEEHPAEEVVTLSNVAPRLGLAWDARGDQSWAVKASYGRFYQRLDGEVALPRTVEERQPHI